MKKEKLLSSKNLHLNLDHLPYATMTCMVSIVLKQKLKNKLPKLLNDCGYFLSSQRKISRWKCTKQTSHRCSGLHDHNMLLHFGKGYISLQCRKQGRVCSFALPFSKGSTHSICFGSVTFKTINIILRFTKCSLKLCNSSPIAQFKSDKCSLHQSVSMYANNKLRSKNIYLGFF